MSACICKHFSLGKTLASTFLVILCELFLSLSISGDLNTTSVRCLTTPVCQLAATSTSRIASGVFEAFSQIVVDLLLAGVTCVWLPHTLPKSDLHSEPSTGAPGSAMCI